MATMTDGAAEDAAALLAGLRAVALAWRAEIDERTERREPDLSVHDALPELERTGWADASAQVTMDDNGASWRTLGIWRALGEVGVLGPWPFVVGFTLPLTAALAQLALLERPAFTALTCPPPSSSAWATTKRTADAVVLRMPWWEGVQHVLLPVPSEEGLQVDIIDVEDLNPDELVVRTPQHHSIAVAEVRPGDVADRRRMSSTGCEPAFRHAARVFDRVLDARAVGAATAALEQTLQHVRQREQFGRPIGSFQAVKHQVAWIATRVRSADLLLQRALAAAADPGNEAEIVRRSCRHFVQENCRMAVETAIHCHGGVGVTWEASLHLLYRAVMENSLLLDSPDRHITALKGLISVEADTQRLGA